MQIRDRWLTPSLFSVIISTYGKEKPLQIKLKGVIILGINIKDLGLADKKVVRETVKAPQGLIEIYEPSVDDVLFILDLQNESMGDKDISEVNAVSFDGKTVLTKIFPSLTNIDMTGVSEEELDNIIENPSIQLLIAQQYVAQIISEINLLYTEQMKTKLKESENLMSMVQLMNEIPVAIMESAKQSGQYSELVENVERLSKEVEKAMELEDEKAEEESKEVIG